MEKDLMFSEIVKMLDKVMDEAHDYAFFQLYSNKHIKLDGEFDCELLRKICNILDLFEEKK